MDLKNLKKATKFLDKIENIDKQIVEIEKIALSILNDKTKIQFDLKVENISKGKELEQPKESSNPFKDLEERMMMAIQIPTWALNHQESKKNKNTFSISDDINDKLALQILGIVLSEKNSERKCLIKELHALGFSV
jgi:hypothetical protein